jgi:hypothetical protein
MIHKSKYYLIFFIVFLFQANEMLAQKRKKGFSTIESINFYQKKNITTYMIFPFGTVNLKGKWEAVKFNKVSKQKTFRNADSIEILVCINECRNYEFNNDTKASNDSFIERFYTWEKEYFEQNPTLKATIIEHDTINNYLIWNLKGKMNEDEIDTIFFIAEKNCNVISLSMYATKLMSTEDRIKLIKETYNNK